MKHSVLCRAAVWSHLRHRAQRVDEARVTHIGKCDERRVAEDKILERLQDSTYSCTFQRFTKDKDIDTELSDGVQRLGADFFKRLKRRNMQPDAVARPSLSLLIRCDKVPNNNNHYIISLN